MNIVCPALRIPHTPGEEEEAGADKGKTQDGDAARRTAIAQAGRAQRPVPGRRGLTAAENTQRFRQGDEACQQKQQRQPDKRRENDDIDARQPEHRVARADRVQPREKGVMQHDTGACQAEDDNGEQAQAPTRGITRRVSGFAGCCGSVEGIFHSDGANFRIGVKHRIAGAATG